jgi:hypothetical protein
MSTARQKTSPAQMETGRQIDQPIKKPRQYWKLLSLPVIAQILGIIE